MVKLFFAGLLLVNLLLLGCLTMNPNITNDNVEQKSILEEVSESVIVECPENNANYDLCTSANGRLKIKSYAGFCDFKNEGSKSGTKCVNVKLIGFIFDEDALESEEYILDNQEICATVNAESEIRKTYILNNEFYKTFEFNQVGMYSEAKTNSIVEFLDPEECLE